MDQIPTDIFPVTANADDGYRRFLPPDGKYFTSAGSQTLAGGHSNYSYDSFMRFTGITIPRGAVITNAKLLFVCYPSYSGVICNTRIQAEHADNPSAVTSYDDYTNRVKTAEYVDWDGIPVWVDGNPYESPDIADVISDVIEEDWWDSGDALQIFWFDHGSSPGVSLCLRSAASIEHATRTEPRLEITWAFKGSTELQGKAAVRHVGTPVELLSKFEIPATFSLSGRTRDRDGNRLGDCEVALFRTIAGNPPTYLFIESGMSDANALYSFTNLIRTKYFVRARKDGSPNVFDTTDNEITSV